MISLIFSIKISEFVDDTSEMKSNMKDLKTSSK